MSRSGRSPPGPHEDLFINASAVYFGVDLHLYYPWMPRRQRMRSDAPMDVYITIDTEVWPYFPKWRATRLAGEIDRCIYGISDGGEFGVRFQLDLMDAHNVQGVFFVEPLFSRVAGIAPLQDLVSLITSRGHDIQLHVHSEWLALIEPELIPGRRSQHLKHLTIDEQEFLLRDAKRTLEEAGAPPLRAFRAGNFGANLDTLRALRRIGITIDSSYNPAAPKHACGIELPLRRLLLQPAEIENVIEFPISLFEDWPGHLRPAQICAISSGEMERALDGAWRSGWSSFVVLSHSFELLRSGTPRGVRPQPCLFTVKRLENLCRFLQKNSTRFRSATFVTPPPQLPPAGTPAPPLRGSLLQTAWRFREQLRKRFYG